MIKALFIFNRNKQKTYSLYISLLHPEVTCLLEDRDGTLWVGTRKGISVTNPYGTTITNISAHNSEVYPFGRWPVNAILQTDTNTLLIGTQNGDGIHETDLLLFQKKHYHEIVVE